MRIVVHADAAGAEHAAAALLRDHIAATPAPVPGLATGHTMLPVYARLRAWFAEGRLSFAACRSFNLDDYCGLAPGDPSSFAAYMRRNLFDHVDMPAANIHFPDEADPSGYDRLIRNAGGIGLQLLGIGRNGHIGFNEPGADAGARTRIVALTPSTRKANAKDFPPGVAVPTHAVTMGIATILDAHRIVLLATGAAKAESLARAVRGPVGDDCPASHLQRHRDVTVICDRAAAAHLETAT